MKGSKQSRRDAKQLFQSCQVDGALDEARVRQAVALLIEKKPRGYFGTLQELQRLVKLDVNNRSARVESAVALSEAQQHYIGGWDNTGPNNLFFSLFHDAALHAQYDLAFWMEADVYAVSSGWVERLREEARAPRFSW